MTSMEQPLKKRKLLPDPIPAASPPPLSPPQQQPHEELVTAPPPPSLQQLSQEEILRKRMNKEEVRSLYECYKRIRICLSKKDAGLVPDFEQAYLSFITASQGCTSVQRITAELIPRYASFCPSALEAAVKVAISMHNQSLSTIMKGEDFDCIAYQTAKACVFGLVDICLAASSEAPKSCVIRKICSGVYMHVMTFLTSTFEGKGVYQLSANEIMKLFGTAESFSQLKQERSETNEAVPYRLFKFHVHSLLRIFICCPRSSLTALFELLSGTNSGKQKNAEYFLCQVTSHLITDEFRHILSKDSNLGVLFTNGIETAIEGRQNDKEKEMFPAGYDDQKQAHIPCKCLLKLLTVRDSSLPHWILSKYKRLSPTIRSEVVSKLSSSLACIFGSLSEITSTSDCYEDKDENNFDLLELINHPYMLHRPFIGLDKSGVLFCEDSLSKVPDAPTTSTPHKNSGGNEIPDQMVKTCGLLLPCEINAQIRNSLSSKIEASRPKRTLGNVESENSCQEEPSVSKNIVESASFKSKIHRTEAELESTSGIVTNSLSTSKHHMEINQSMWCYDSDATSMDVFSASNLLLLSSFGNDTPETAVRLQFEEFGPLEKFLFYPAKNFAVLEYRSIMDAVRARDYMHGSSPWGRSLSLKFLDIGFGSRGAVNGTVFSDSCFVYVGKVSSQQAKEEILYELSKWLSRPPLRIMDLGSGNTLLLEFVTSEEAAIATSYIRRKRCRSGCDISQGNNLTSSASRTDKSSGCRLLVRHIDMSVSDEELINVFSGFGELSGWKFMRQIGCCLMYFSSFQDALCAKTHLDGSRFGATPVRVEIMTDSSSSLLSPSSKTVENLSSDSSKIIRQLSSRFASLHTKYNISQSSGNGETHKHKYSSSPMVDDRDHCVTNSLFLSFPDSSSQLITDHELLEICNIAAGNIGSVIRLTRTITNCSCYVEFSNKDAAVTALGNMRNCQGMPFQIEFRNHIDSSHHSEGYHSSGNRCASGHFLSHVEFHSISSDSKHGIHYGTEFQMKPDNISNLISPRMKVEAFGNEVQNANSCPPNWNRTDSTEASEPTGKGIDAHVTSHPTEQVWQCRNPDIDTQTLPPGNLSHIPPVRHGGAVILPPPPIQVSSFTPSYVTSSSSWNNMPPNSNVYSHQCAPVPFIPSSVTPLAQLQSNFIPHFEQTPPPPPPDVPPPPSPPPPPLPMCQPPPIPPPPSSPPLQPLPPQTTHVKSSLQSKGSSENHKWLGTLCKSGVHYCTVYATRVNSDACNYSGTVFEPADWPAKLDITKRTDFRHVKATFISTPQHRREVCLLFPSSAADQKGFHDFISYLKQRECAGVIKIPSGTVRWARLLFILPCSTDICSLLSIPPQPSECLIALILPKETNPERVTS